MSCLLIDSNCICHISKHSMGHLSWEDKQTGIVFGFFEYILKLAHIFETNNFIFAWDSRRSLRRDIYPTYKMNRKKEMTAEEKVLNDLSYDQFTVLRQLYLPSIGFSNNFICTGFEADDIIASVVRGHLLTHMTIISTDEDLYQLLDENVSMYSPRSKKLMTVNDFKQRYKITPSKWSTVKAIAGCTSDNVAGIDGVGEAYAIQYLLGKLKPTTKAFQKIISTEGKKIKERNMPLVDLPFKDTPHVSRMVFETQLNIDAFILMCNRLGFRSFLYNGTFKKWKKYVFKEA